MSDIKYIRLDKIKPPEFDQRITQSQEDDDELRDSIREIGLLEPVLVKEVTDGYEIIAGNRRFRESGRAGLAAIRCIIIKTTGAAADKIALHENIHRLPLSHIDQAYTFSHLVKKYNMTETQVSVVVGKSLAYVSQHLCLLQSDDILVQAVSDGRINFSVARELMLCKDPDERARFIKIVEENGATSPVVHSWVNESNRETVSTHVDTNNAVHYDRPADKQEPLYPCAACNIHIPVSDIKYVRICPDCHYLIFSDIERAKQKERQKTSTVPI